MSRYENNRSIADWSLWGQAEELDPEDFGPFTERQSALFWFQIGLTQAFGKYDQSTGPDGAHYMNSVDNPFGEEGLSCENCAFFEGATTCEIVDGNIDPRGLCRFWVIPESSMQVSTPEPNPEMPKQAAGKMKKPKKPKKWAY